LSLVCALTCGILLVAEMLLEVWFRRWIQASHAVDLDGVELVMGADPLVWITSWCPKRMWSVEAIPWVSLLRAMDF
jgi:hypothetical protein